MKQERFARLQRWVEKNRWRIDVKAGTVLSRNGKRLVGALTPLGYVQARTWEDGQLSTYRLHQIIAVAAGLDLRGNLQVNHLNGNKQDNRIANLEVVTPSENMRHAYATGLLKMPLAHGFGRFNRVYTHCGERNGQAKLTWEAVAAIRQEYATQRTTYKKLAERYSVSQHVIECVVTGRTWRVPGYVHVSRRRNQHTLPKAA